MPLDSRRINGPPESFPVSNFGGQITQKRLVVTDGRKATDVRPIFLRAGVVSNAKGSAYIETKNTKVICAVYGPRQVVRREDFKLTGTLKCEFKLTTFSCKQRQQHQQSVVDKDVSLTLQQALEPAVCLDKYPRAQIDIFISVLQNDGGVLGASITCASVALADAGIDMFDVVVGCTLRQAGEVAILDPTYEEEYDSKDEGDNNGSIVVGLLPSMNQISVLIQSGDLDNEVSQQGIRSCIEGCMRTYPVVRECLVKSVKTMNLGKEKGS